MYNEERETGEAMTGSVGFIWYGPGRTGRGGKKRTTATRTVRQGRKKVGRETRGRETKDGPPAKKTT